MRTAMLETHECSWDNFWKWTGPGGIVISQIPSGRHAELLGKTMTEAARSRGHGDPLEFALDLLRDEAMGVGMVSHSQDERIVARFLALPYVNVCTDALLGGRPHPRAYGTYPRVIAKYVRNEHLVTLEEAIRKMTSQAANAFALTDVGTVAPGMRANLVAFEVNRVRDTATFADPVSYPEGIEYVVVGGEVAVSRGEVTQATGIRNGRVIRRK
jgi:N-acyl-D-amino-acid deacylase